MVFYSSDFSQALVLVLDYAGNRECNSYYHFQGDRRDVLRQDSLPEDSAGGFGAAYSFVSDIIGFPGMTQAGKTMALAGFGKAMESAVGISRTNTAVRGLDLPLSPGIPRPNGSIGKLAPAWRLQRIC